MSDSELRELRGRVESLEQRVARVEIAVGDLSQRTTRVEQALTYQSTKVDDLSTKVYVLIGIALATLGTSVVRLDPTSPPQLAVGAAAVGVGAASVAYLLLRCVFKLSRCRL